MVRILSLPVRMLLNITVLFTGILANAPPARMSATSPSDGAFLTPIRIIGPEQSHFDPTLPDGGLPAAWGVQNFQVFRASRSRPELTDRKGWTYNHHVDMACWRGLLYVAWDSGEKDEDVWPARELFSVSADGAHWSPPIELFPQGISTPLRMYFFHSKTGHMLALAGLRTNQEKTEETKKSGLIVRQINIDRSLGPVYTLRSPDIAENVSLPSSFTTSADPGFVQSCQELLSNSPFLEQQDYGNLLASQRMKWHTPSNWPKGIKPDKFGKAFSFYHRKDGKLAAIGKMGWVTVSGDEGRSWSPPIISPSLVTGRAKVWGQRTSDGRYALLYNPSEKCPSPLIVVCGDDGITFKDMRVVHGELNPMRYEGKAKERGPRYVRGISEWANDGSWADKSLWAVYSLNEEDIWVSRIPIPMRTMPPLPIDDDFQSAPIGPLVPGWNTYSPRWAPVAIAEAVSGGENCLRLEDGDPYDYALAARLFPATKKVHVSFNILARQADRGVLEIEMGEASGGARPIRITLTKSGNVSVSSTLATDMKTVDSANTKQGITDLIVAPYRAGEWMQVQIDADTDSQLFSLTVDGKMVMKDAKYVEPAHSLAKITFRTGVYRGMGATPPILLESDTLQLPVIYELRRLKIQH